LLAWGVEAIDGDFSSYFATETYRIKQIGINGIVGIGIDAEYHFFLTYSRMQGRCRALDLGSCWRGACLKFMNFTQVAKAAATLPLPARKHH